MIVVLLAGWSSLAVAQEHPIVDAGGYQHNRDSFSGAPFESIDTLNGGLVLTFTDLALPGNAGRDLRFQRTYNSKGKARGQWSFGLAGYVLRIEDSTEAAFPPVLFPADGSLQRTVFTQSGSTNVASTSGFAQYNRSARTLSMPDGTTCYYEAPTATERRLTHCYSVFGANSFPPVKEVELVWGAGTLTVRQNLGNGQTRTVDVTWEEGTLLPATMTFLGRTWTYAYESPLESRPPVISEVTPPAGPGWTFEYQVHEPGVALPPDDTELHNPDNPRHRPEIELFKVTTPQGGVIRYTYGDIAFAKVDYVEGTPPARLDSVTRGVRRRETEDDGQTLGSWTYTYTDLGSAQHTLVESSVGARTTYRYEEIAPQANVFDGSSWGMRSRTTEGLQGETWVVLEDEALLYQVVPVVQSGRGTPEVTSRTITRVGRTYVTTFEYDALNFGDYHSPKRIVETGESGVTSRVTERTYFHRENPTVVAKLAIEKVTVNGETFRTERKYNPNSGALTTEIIGGTDEAPGITTDFTTDSTTGNVTSVRKGNNKVTTLTYSWGQVSSINRGSGVITRDARPEGFIAAETRGRRTTRYQYDQMFRPGEDDAAPGARRPKCDHHRIRQCGHMGEDATRELPRHHDFRRLRPSSLCPQQRRRRDDHPLRC